MQVESTVEDIRRLEEILVNTCRLDVFHDGSKRYAKFGDKGLRSATYRKVFVVALDGGSWLLAKKVVLKFFYDHRDGIARLYLPDSQVGQLKRRSPQFGEELERVALLREQPGNGFVTRCPKCGAVLNNVGAGRPQSG